MAGIISARHVNTNPLGVSELLPECTFLKLTARFDRQPDAGREAFPD